MTNTDTIDGEPYWQVTVHAHQTQRSWKLVRAILRRQPGFRSLSSDPDVEELTPKPGHVRADQIGTIRAEYETEAQAQAATAAVNAGLKYEYKWTITHRPRRD